MQSKNGKNKPEVSFAFNFTFNFLNSLAIFCEKIMFNIYKNNALMHLFLDIIKI